MKHCFYRLTAAYNMRIVQVMEAEHRYQQGFYALAHNVRMCCAVGRLFFKPVYTVAWAGCPCCPI